MQLYQEYFHLIPRFTSYPSRKGWKALQGKEHQKVHLKDYLQSLHKIEQIDLYIHIPFCESICTFCGLNIYVTKDQSIQEHYIDNLIKEWNFYRQYLGKTKIGNIYFGGGTPNYLQGKHLAKLLSQILRDRSHQGLAIEMAPQLLKDEFLQVLEEFACNYVSIGIQDFSPKVTKNINRGLDTESLARTLIKLRHYNFQHINWDLMNGLPGQTKETWKVNRHFLSELNPDSFYLYPYIKVPWLEKIQRSLGGVHNPKEHEIFENPSKINFTINRRFNALYLSRYGFLS